jgi:hypothetical protein
MKKLGRGWQYTVYDLGNGRVLKCWNSRPVAYMMMCSDRILALRFWRFPMYYRASTSTATYSLRELKKSPLPMSLFGNPKYLENGFDYEQDKLLPIDEYLKTVSIEKQKEMVDKFVVFNKFLIQNSCIDKSFNMGTNFALGKGGNIVLSDIGELYFTEKLIAQQINRKAWAKPYVLGPLPKELRSYFLEKMESLSFLYMQKTCIDKLAFVELKDRKVLETKSKGKDIWYIPGGKRDEGESDEQALVREIKEELNVEIDPTTIVLLRNL